uniref:Nuclear receptor domain-containing protein n=1 Tax=Panagrellus redivivus TaxID=6233 RepID=A0A7E4W4X8_PANRE
MDSPPLLPDPEDRASLPVLHPAELQCCICHHVSHGYHFGVLACRACAAFFRRTVAEKKVYKCRGNFNCEVRKDQRNMCRACRFRKCEILGMNKNDVQMNRDPIGKKHETQTLKTVKLEPGLSLDESDTIFDVHRQKPVFNSPYELPIDPQCGQFITLEKIVAGVKSYHESQKTLVSKEILESNELHYINNTTCREMDMKCLPLLYKMVVKYFDPFDKLDKMTKIHTIQNYAVRHQLLTSVYYTVCNLDKMPPYTWMLYYGQYVQGFDPAAFIGECPNQQEIVKMMGSIIPRIIKIKDAYIDLHINDMMHSAMIGILFWQEVSNLVPLWKEAVHKRETIFKELHDYVICHHGQKSAGSRIGALTSLIEETNFVSHLMMEQDTFEKIFNTPRKDVIDVLKDFE